MLSSEGSFHYTPSHLECGLGFLLTLQRFPTRRKLCNLLIPNLFNSLPDWVFFHKNLLSVKDQETISTHFFCYCFYFMIAIPFFWAYIYEAFMSDAVLKCFTTLLHLILTIILQDLTVPTLWRKLRLIQTDASTRVHAQSPSILYSEPNFLIPCGKVRGPHMLYLSSK